MPAPKDKHTKQLDSYIAKVSELGKDFETKQTGTTLSIAEIESKDKLAESIAYQISRLNHKTTPIFETKTHYNHKGVEAMFEVTQKHFVYLKWNDGEWIVAVVNNSKEMQEHIKNEFE